MLSVVVCAVAVSSAGDKPWGDAMQQGARAAGAGGAQAAQKAADDAKFSIDDDYEEFAVDLIR